MKRFVLLFLFNLLFIGRIAGGWFRYSIKSNRYEQDKGGWGNSLNCHPERVHGRSRPLFSFSSGLKNRIMVEMFPGLHSRRTLEPPGPVSGARLIFALIEHIHPYPDDEPDRPCLTK
jgi:hypothetical protein